MRDHEVERLRLIIADAENGFVTMRKDFAEDIKLSLEFRNADIHARNAAQQRAEQAERERDEARELLSRIRAITTAAPQPAPTVKAAEPLWRSMTHLVGVGEISYSDTMNLIGHRLRIAHDCINQSETQTDAALEQMHHALVLLYHALDLKGGAS